MTHWCFLLATMVRGWLNRAVPGQRDLLRGNGELKLGILIVHWRGHYADCIYCSTRELTHLLLARYRRLQENVPHNCTACPHGYVPSRHTGDIIKSDQPHHLCTLPGTDLVLNGVHCGEDTGLGSVWEANLRMPALARWPGKISAGSETKTLVSTLDVIPTILSIVGLHDNEQAKCKLDGRDISSVLFEKFRDDGETDRCHNEGDRSRVLFFWRDGFSSGPLPPPFGRFDVAAV